MKMTHNDTTCIKYDEPVLPDEEGNCSLCGARLTPTEEGWKSMGNLEKDHASIKKRIKEWETIIDGIIYCPTPKCEDCMNKLESLSHKMMAINL
jgi:hypothetical protein